MLSWVYLILFRILCLYEREGVDAMLVGTHSLYQSKQRTTRVLNFAIRCHGTAAIELIERRPALDDRYLPNSRI
jgi:hypothetical protein